MALTYPLTPPASPTFNGLTFTPNTVVGEAMSSFTGSSQTSVWPGQWWVVQGQLPPIPNTAEADAWVAFKLALNGKQGTFLLGDVSRRLSRGNPSGTWQVGAGAVANTSTLPLQTGAGNLAVADWLQIGTGASAKLYKITQVNSQYSVEVWPFLRSSHAQGTNVVYANAVGVFQLAENAGMDWSVNVAKFFGLTLNARERL